jgi:4a-hydroxytetrahydrobiopterin dehydratase
MGIAHQSCQSEVSVLAPEETGRLHREVRDWTLEEKSLTRQFAFDDFEEAMDFVNDVASLASEEDHHPDIHIFYNKVKLELSTHKVEGLSRNDFVMAAKIDELVA